RNVALTGPWGHAGAYDSLEAVIRHHLDPTAALEQYDSSQAVLPSRPDLDALDLIAFLDPARRAEITQTVELTPVVLTDAQIVDLLEFLRSLTDPASMDLRLDLPTRVPSGLPMAD
ncbi:MAG: cytochrome-c peroxidase, partial [Blastocatellia bacterium]